MTFTCKYCNKILRDPVDSGGSFTFYCINCCNIRYITVQFYVKNNIKKDIREVIIRSPYHLMVIEDTIKTRIYDYYNNFSRLILKFDYAININPTNFEDKIKLLLTFS